MTDHTNQPTDRRQQRQTPPQQPQRYTQQQGQTQPGYQQPQQSGGQYQQQPHQQYQQPRQQTGQQPQQQYQQPRQQTGQQPQQQSGHQQTGQQFRQPSQQGGLGAQPVQQGTGAHPVQHQGGGIQQRGQAMSQRREGAQTGSVQQYLKPARVNQIITEDVVTAQRDTPIHTVVAQMAEKDVGSVVVVQDDRPIGIITDRAVAVALEETPDIAQQRADALIDGELVTADPSMTIFDALQVMSDEGIRRLPIVDDDGSLRGIITLDDVLVLLGGVFGEIARTIESQSPRL